MKLIRLFLALILFAATATLATGAPGYVRLEPGQLQGRNLLINGNFLIDQRAYTSGATLTNGAYGHDRWLNVSGNSSYTFTQSSISEYGSGTTDTTLTLPSGLYLAQRIERSLVLGGSYVLSWSGAATCQLGYFTNSTAITTVTSLNVSPLVGTLPVGVTGYVQCTNGTLTDIQLEAGTVPTTFERRSPGTELALCQRYYQLAYPSLRTTTASSSQITENSIYFQPMRTAPTAVLVTAGNRSGNVSSVVLNQLTPSSSRFTVNVNASGDTYVLVDTWALSAEF